MTADQLPTVPPALAGVEVAVIGDAILDRYLETVDAGRCREVDAPALTVRTMASVPGGAANAAVTIAVLGGRARLIASVGNDTAGADLVASTSGHGVDTARVAGGRRETLVKTRLFRNGAQVLRFDSGATTHHGGPSGSVDLARAGLAGSHLLVSDYGYGALGEDAASTVARSGCSTLVVDAVDLRRWAPAAPTLAICDERQLQRLGAGDVGAGADRGDLLLRESGASAVVVTLADRGAVLFRPRAQPRRLAVDPVDGSAPGSGDVLAASVTLCLAAGLPMDEAIGFAVAAATAATRAAVESRRTAVFPRTTGTGLPPSAAPGSVDDPDLARWLGEAHANGARIVFANGCFDLLHEGHVALLDSAKKLGDVLVVAVNDDAGVRELKGAGRPVVGLRGRMRMLEALTCVDRVVAFAGTSPEPLLRLVRPHVFVKGGDYTPATIPEAALLARMGVDVQVISQIEDCSTTRLVQRARIGG